MNRLSFRSLLFVFCALLLWSGTARAQQDEQDRRYKLAMSYEANGDIPGAARIYRELYEQDSESRAFFDGLQRTLLALRRFSELLPFVNARVERYPKDPELRVLRAELLAQTGQGEEAEKEWNEALRIGAGEPEVYTLVGESYTKLRLFDKGAKVYETARNRFGRNPVVADRLARLYAILGEYEKAANEYVDLLADDPSRLSYVQAGLSLITDVPAGVEAAIKITEHLADVRKRPEYLELLAWLYSEKGDDRTAFEVTVRLDKARNAKGSSIYAFADRKLREGKYDAALAGYEYFLANFDRKNPLTPPVIYNYVLALQSQYDQNGAVTEEQAKELIARYREVVEYGKGGTLGDQAVMRIARLQADVLNDPEQALQTLNTEIRSPNSAVASEAALFRADLALRLGRVEEARELYRRTIVGAGMSREEETIRSQARLRYAETLLYTGDFKEGVDSLTALTQNIESDAANDALAWLFLLQENLDINDPALKEYAKGTYANVRRDWPEVIRAMEQAVALAPQSSLADDALMYKASAQRELRRYEEAIATLLSIPEKYPDGTHADRALYRAAQIAETDLKDNARALDLYTKILVEYPYSQHVSQARDKIRELRQES